ncbi:MAG: zinc-dependent metalloprotease, partial [Gemmatimonadota bacterium]
MKRSLVALLFLAFASQTGVAQEKKGEEKGKKPDKYKKFAELVERARAQEGFFDLYRKDDKLYLAVPRDRLGANFLMYVEIARGIGARSLFGGTMLNIFEGKLVALERHGEKVFLVQRPHRFTAKNDPAAAQAVGLTFGASVLESAKIESVREDSALVVDVAGWFVSDLSGISQRVKFAVSRTPGKPGSASFDKSRSYLESVEAFPRNVNVRAKLTFKPSQPVGFPSVPDGRFLPVSIHYTLAELPEEPMTPRYGDDRVGSFWTVHKDFSQEDSTFFVRLVNRWRLEPGQKVGDKWRPKKPIVYYIDRNVPEDYRAAMKAGVDGWNEAFEAAGWVDAIHAEDLPEGADPEDIRYATLRWNVSDQPGYGAIGPSIVDPRTGEILDADILFEANMFLGFKRAWQDFIGPVSAAEAFESTLSFDEAELASVESGGELSSFASVLADQGALLAGVLAARGEIRPGEPVPNEYLNEVIKWVTMHEVGHSLGLQHNFRSSASTPFDKLHDRAWAEENGVFSSVMEYPTVNVAPAGKPNGHYYNPGAGSYDRWAISYAYTPDPERAAELAREVADKRHLFGTNADAGGPGATDPTINVYDLSDDPLAWGKERIGIVEELWQKLPEVVLDDNARYYDLTVGFGRLANEYVRALAPAVKYIGGQYLNRDHVGDPSGRLPFVNVPVAEQREALDFLAEKVFAADAFAVPAEVLEKMGPNRWLH